MIAKPLAAVAQARLTSPGSGLRAVAYLTRDAGVAYNPIAPSKMLRHRLGWLYQPKRPVFISAVLAIILVFLLLSAFLVYRFSVSGKADRETITFGVSVVGAAIAIYGLLRVADATRQANAERFTATSIAFVQRWNSPSYLPLKKEWRLLNDEIDKLPEADRDALLSNDVDRRSTAVEVLNFFEEMATGINSESLDNLLLRRYFEVVVVRAFDRYSYWIKQHRIRKSADGFFDELEQVAQEWKKPSP